MPIPASDIATPAIVQVSAIETRRPIASEIHEQKKRPTICPRLSQITRPEACAGVTCRTMTNSVTCHKRNLVMPVPLRPARQPAATLRGYLNNSCQTSFSTGRATAGSWISFGSTINAQARD